MTTSKRLSIALFAVALLGFLAYVLPGYVVKHGERPFPQLEREARILAPVDAVYARLSDLRSYAAWSPWAVGGASITGERTVDGHPGFDWKGPSTAGTLALVARDDTARAVDFVERAGAFVVPGRLRVVTTPDDRAVVVWIIPMDGKARLAGRVGTEAVTAAADEALARLKASLEAESGRKDVETRGPDEPPAEAK